MQRISFRMKSRRAVASFNRWCEYIDERLYQRKLVGKVFNRLVKGQVVAAWTSWKDFVLNDTHIKQLMKRVAMRLKGDRLERCYTYVSVS